MSHSLSLSSSPSLSISLLLSLSPSLSPSRLRPKGLVRRRPWKRRPLIFTRTHEEAISNQPPCVGLKGNQREPMHFFGPHILTHAHVVSCTGKTERVQLSTRRDPFRRHFKNQTPVIQDLLHVRF